MEQELKPTQELMGLFARLQGLDLGHPRIKDSGLSLPQFSMLSRIWMEPGLRVQDVADRLGVTTPTVSVALRKLETNGWLQRKTDPNDKRCSRLFLSAKAQLLARQASKRRDAHINEFMNGLNKSEQRQLLTLLDKAITNLEIKRTSKQKKVSGSSKE